MVERERIYAYDSPTLSTGFNHAGITVPDIEAAADWYIRVFELRLLGGPIDCSLTTEGADRRLDVFGPQWSAMRLVHLEGENGGGVELFEFVAPGVEPVDEPFAYWRVGPHHIALTVSDFDATLARLLEHGGTQRSAVHQVHENARVCYCADPWGNVVEIVSTTYAGLVAPAG